MISPFQVVKATVHPRIRGERGENCKSYWIQGRFIPAYAGNAGVTLRAALMEAVHPRIRGERPISLLRIGYRCGSSPHTRGTRINRNRL